MVRSGWWDVGFSLGRGGYELRAREGRLRVGADGPFWSKVEGTFALNRGAHRGGLNVLTVNQDWLGSELVDRLRAELPYERRTCLARAVIHSRDWGVAGDRAASASECPAFSLEAPAERRDNSIHWLGTRAVKAHRIELSADRVVGELRLHLLRDEVSGAQLSVVFGEKRVFVDEWRGGESARRLYTAGRPAGPVRAVITLDGDRLGLAVEGLAPWASPPLRLPDGALVMQVLERMRGVARAEGVRLTFEPLRPAPLAATTP
jgi:hypothetical protein